VRIRVFQEAFEKCAIRDDVLRTAKQCAESSKLNLAIARKIDAFD
jgi:hypothetical protein